MTSGDYEFQEQQAMDAHNQALFAELRDREISLHNREAAKLHGRAATIRRLLEGRALYRQVAAELYQMHEATGPVPEDVSLSDALCYVDEFAAEAAERGRDETSTTPIRATDLCDAKRGTVHTHERALYLPDGQD